MLKVGNLSARRDISDVRDVAAAYAALLVHGEAGVAYNVGSGRSHAIGDLLNQLVAMSHVPITVTVDPARLRPVDVPDVVCDNRRLCTTTGWQPHISLATTLQDMLNYWRHAIKETQA